VAEHETHRKLDVVGIGSMAVDRLHRPPRILVAGEKGILGDVEGQGSVKSYVGGVVLNHLGWARVLGLTTGIFGRQANDEAGRFLRAAMKRMGIETHIAIEGRASTVAEIFVDDAGERSIYMAPGTTLGTTAQHVREHHAEFIRRADRLSTEISQLPLAAVLEALSIAREAGIPTVLDLDVPPSEALAALGDRATLERVLALADVLKPSKLAGRELFPELGDQPLALARAVREHYANQAVLVTDGESGCAIASAEFEGLVPGRKVEAVDTTGAGDAFLGGLLAALHYGLGWQQAGALANACGAACVERMGAFPDDPAAARSRALALYAGPELELGPLPAAAMGPAVEEADGEVGLRVLDAAAREIGALRQRLPGGQLVAAAALVEASRAGGGRVHVTGVGKSEHVARYGASLLSSTGTPASFLHTTEALHGSLGQVVSGDAVIAISNSGTTQEVLQVVKALEAMGARIIAVAGDASSPLARRAQVLLEAGVSQEGGPLGLAPRASVAAQSLVLAALGAVLQERAGFSRADYAARHPAGALGRKARQ
jgi:sugar/nucleoside kinase (ribokinase family)/D-arabinose 5-phosphate isomerase GutQ